MEESPCASFAKVVESLHRVTSWCDFKEWIFSKTQKEKQKKPKRKPKLRKS